jgi:CBS domain-containing protein
MQTPIRKVLALKGHNVASISHDQTVLAAVTQMNDGRIGALIVTHDDRPVGIFTERDVLTRVIAQHLDAGRTVVKEVMTRNLFTVTASATVMEAMMTMTDRRCRHLPVMDGDALVGMISIGDLTSWVVRDQQRTIEELHDYLHRS